MAQSAGVLKDQKVIVQRVEAKSAADLELAQRDIAHLHARIVELQEEKRAAGARAEAVNVALADVQAAAAKACAESASSESARCASLDAYARQLLATRFLLKKWRAELAQRKTAEGLYDRVRVAKGWRGARRCTSLPPTRTRTHTHPPHALHTHSRGTDARGEERV